ALALDFVSVSSLKYESEGATTLDARSAERQRSRSRSGMACSTLRPPLRPRKTIRFRCPPSRHSGGTSGSVFRYRLPLCRCCPCCPRSPDVGSGILQPSGHCGRAGPAPADCFGSECRFHVGVFSDIEATLCLVRGEVHRNGCSNDVGVFADNLLCNETAFAGLAGRIVARLAERRIVLF